MSALTSQKRTFASSPPQAPTFYPHHPQQLSTPRSPPVLTKAQIKQTVSISESELGVTAFSLHRQKIPNISATQYEQTSVLAMSGSPQYTFKERPDDPNLYDQQLSPIEPSQEDLMVVGGGPVLKEVTMSISPKLKKAAKRPSTSSTNAGKRPTGNRKVSQPKKSFQTQAQIYSASLHHDSRGSKKKLRKVGSKSKKTMGVEESRATPVKKKSTTSLLRGKRQEEEMHQHQNYSEIVKETHLHHNFKQEMIAKQRSSIKQAFPMKLVAATNPRRQSPQELDTVIQISRKTPEPRPPSDREIRAGDQLGYLAKWVRSTHTGTLSPARVRKEEIGEGKASISFEQSLVQSKEVKGTKALLTESVNEDIVQKLNHSEPGQGLSKQSEHEPYPLTIFIAQKGNAATKVAPIKTTSPFEKKDKRVVIEKYIRQADTNQSLDEGAFRTPPKQTYMNVTAAPPLTANLRNTVIFKEGEESGTDDPRARYKELMKVGRVLTQTVSQHDQSPKKYQQPQRDQQQTALLMVKQHPLQVKRKPITYHPYQNTVVGSVHSSRQNGAGAVPYSGQPVWMQGAAAMVGGLDDVLQISPAATVSKGSANYSSPIAGRLQGSRGIGVDEINSIKQSLGLLTPREQYTAGGGPTRKFLFDKETLRQGKEVRETLALQLIHHPLHIQGLHESQTEIMSDSVKVLEETRRPTVTEEDQIPHQPPETILPRNSVTYSSSKKASAHITVPLSRQVFLCDYYRVRNTGYEQYSVAPGNNSGIIREIMQRRKWWIEIPPLHTMFNFKWKPTSHGIRWERLGDPLYQRQLVNHFEHHQEVTKKSNLFRNLNAFSELNHDSIFAMVPLTFVVEVDRDRIHLLSAVLQQFATVYNTLRDHAPAVRAVLAQAYPNSPPQEEIDLSQPQDSSSYIQSGSVESQRMNQELKQQRSPSKKKGAKKSPKKPQSNTTSVPSTAAPHPIESAILAVGGHSSNSRQGTGPCFQGAGCIFAATSFVNSTGQNGGGQGQDFKRGSTGGLHKIQIPLPHYTGSNLWLLKPSFLNRGRGIYVINSVEDMKAKILESISQSYPSSQKNKHKNNHQQTGQMPPNRSQTTVVERKKQGEKRKNSLANHIEEADFEEELSFSRKRSASVEREFSAYSKSQSFKKKKKSQSGTSISLKQQLQQEESKQGLLESKKKGSSLVEHAQESGHLPSLPTHHQSPEVAQKKEPQNTASATIAHSSQKCYTFIIQKYIERPLLIWGRRKFDIRVWVLVDHQLNAYFCRQGYLRTASRSFRLTGLADRFIHLTNNAVQKNAKNYGEFEDGNIMSFSEFQHFLDENNPSKASVEEDTESSRYSVKEYIVPTMKAIVTKTLLAVRKKLDSNKRKFCFELFGYDFMLDCDLNVWLIEVNTNPCIEDSSAYLSALLRRMLDDAFKLTVDVCFPKKQVKRKIPSQVERDMERACQAASGITEKLLKQADEEEQKEDDEQKKKKRKEVKLEGVQQSENLWDKLCNLLHPFQDESGSAKRSSAAAKLTKTAKLSQQTVLLQVKEGGRGLKIKRPGVPEQRKKGKK